MDNLNINLTRYVNKDEKFELIAKNIIEYIKSGKQKISKFSLLELD